MRRFVWDEPKRLRNIEIHGLDFEDAVAFEWEHAAITPSYSSRQGRQRFIATGLFEGDLITIVFSLFGAEAYSIISMRRASRKERNDYDERQT